MTSASTRLVASLNLVDRENRKQSAVMNPRVEFTFSWLVELCAMLHDALQRHRPIVGLSLPPGSRCPKCGRIAKSDGSGSTASAFGPPCSRLDGLELLLRN